MNLHVLSRMLTKMGLACETVCHGRDAVAAAKSRAFDLILMVSGGAGVGWWRARGAFRCPTPSSSHPPCPAQDIEMPIMDGLEATRQIRAYELAAPRGTTTRAVKMPIIAVTASALQADHERCMSAGMDGVLTKPLRTQLVVAELRRWL